MRPYLVFGAGAVGSALAAYLARRGHPVRVVAREAHVRAIRGQTGIRAISRTETFLAPVEASSSVPDRLPPGSVIHLTVQSPDVSEALEALGRFLPSTPLITWQNGIRAEELAAPHASSLYGGVVRFTATLLDPGEVRLRAPGKLILGRHPGGDDDRVRSLVEDLRAAGFEAAVSPDIRADKALKLLVNLVSGPPVLLERTGKEPALAAVQVAILEEAIRILEKAGIPAHPASGLGQTPAELLAHFRAGGSAPDTTGGIYNSTWQNLHHRRPRLENRFYHGEIVDLGRQVGLPAPVNARALALLEEVRAEGLGPEPFTPETFRERFEGLVAFDETGTGGSRAEEGSLEI